MMIVYQNETRHGGHVRASGRAGRDGTEGFDAASEEDCYPYTQDCKRLARHLLSSFVSLAFLFCLFGCVQKAFAQPIVDVNGNFAGYEDGEEYLGYVICDSPDAYTSTLTLIGEYGSLIQIDSTMYAKLSSAQHGGMFYKLMQRWEHIGTNKSGSSGNYPTWLSSDSSFGKMYVDTLNAIYGYDRNWELVCSRSEYAQALRDFHTILDGGSAGDDDDVGDDEDTDGTYVYFDYTQIITESLLGGVSGFAITVKTYNEVVKPILDKNRGLLLINRSTATTSLSLVNFSCVPEPQLLSNRSFGITDRVGPYNPSGMTTKTEYNNKTYWVFDLAKGLNTLNPTIGNYVFSQTRDLVAYVWIGETEDGGDGGDDEPITPVDPPDDPLPTPPTVVAPEPPELPTPTNPIPYQPYDPPLPDPPEVPQPPYVYPPEIHYESEPTNTSPIDYTPWLRVIFYQLLDISQLIGEEFDFLFDRLQQCCTSMKDHLTDLVAYLLDYLSDYMQECTEAINQNLAVQATNLMNDSRSLLGYHHDYLKSLAQWIIDNLRWENSGGEYDDSNVLYWLKRVWAKQGTGTVNSRPVDPATDYLGYSAWYGVLSDELALDILDQNLTSLTTAISALQNTFPFSLPWDIQRILQALVVPPATPEITLTLPDTVVEGATYEIDLHWLDSAMVTVRTMEMLIFVAYTLVHTRDLFYAFGGE